MAIAAIGGWVGYFLGGMDGLMIALLLIFLGIIWVIIKRKKLIRSTKETVMELEVENGDVRFRLRDGSIDASPILPPLFLALCTLLAFAPMSGLLDTSYYCFSGPFVKLPRYTPQLRCLFVRGLRRSEVLLSVPEAESAFRKRSPCFLFSACVLFP